MYRYKAFIAQTLNIRYGLLESGTSLCFKTDKRNDTKWSLILNLCSDWHITNIVLSVPQQLRKEENQQIQT